MATEFTASQQIRISLVIDWLGKNRPSINLKEEGTRIFPFERDSLDKVWISVKHEEGHWISLVFVVTQGEVQLEKKGPI